MARIAGTGKPPERRVLVRRVRLDPIAVAAIFSPVAMLAPDEWLRAVSIVMALGAAWFVGHRAGRAEVAREILRDLRSDDRGA